MIMRAPQMAFAAAAVFAILTPLATGSKEEFRPQFHFSPSANWLNDPNGLVYVSGEFHMFFQHNPFRPDWGDISWGHAVSQDLVKWTELPVALWFSDEEAIFSGSAVVDTANSAGFGRAGETAIVAIYTSARDGHQAQALAYSVDRGLSWTKYAQNPVLDFGLSEFRDPKVFWHADSRCWIMVVVKSTEHKVQFYASSNLKQWRLLSEFGPAHSQDGAWECPDLFSLSVDGDPARTKWVLIVSVGQGGVPGGSATQYFIGDFDGIRFALDPDSTYVPAWNRSSSAWLDYGKDYYAAVSWESWGSGSRRTMIGWMSNWLYAREVPTSQWRNGMSAPRDVRLKTVGGQVRLVQAPVAGLEALRGERHNLTSTPVTEGAVMLPITSTAFDLTATILAKGARRFGITVREGIAEQTVIAYNVDAQELCVDRTRSGRTSFSRDFSGVHCAPVKLQNGLLRMRVLVDWASVEVFAQEGEVVITDLIFPKAGSDLVSLFADGGSAELVTGVAWTMKAYRGD